MKKNFTIIASILAFGMVATSCVKDLDETVGVEGGKLVQHTISVVAEQPTNEIQDTTPNAQSRAYRDENGIIRWVAGDQIMLFDGATTSTASVADGSDQQQANSADFVYSLTEGTSWGETVYGIFPAARYVGLTDTSLKVELPRMQCYTTLNQAVHNSILVGKHDGTNLHLYNTTSIIRVKLTGNGETLQAVSLMSRSKSLSGLAYIDLSQEKPVLIPSDAWKDGELHESTGGIITNIVANTGEGRKFESEVTLSSTPLELYFVVPARNYPAGDLYLEVVTDSYATTKVSKSDNNIERNHIKPFAAIGVAATAYEGVVEDLSAGGRANCYVVAPATEAKHYSFDMTLNDGTSALGSGNSITSAQVAWQTADNLVQNVSINNGKISFTVPANSGQGSAMIILSTYQRNTTNQTEVNWLWHIWVSDTQDQEIGGYTVMDRNLGAMWIPTSESEVPVTDGAQAAKASGFYYQWGRPVPMPGPKDLGAALSNGREAVVNQKYDLPADNMQEVFINKFFPQTQGFTRYAWNNPEFRSRRFPMKFLKVTVATSPKYTHQSSWSTDVVATGEGQTWSASKQTNFDPCPAGYRLGTTADWLGLNTALGSASPLTYKKAGHFSGEDDTKNYGGAFGLYNSNTSTSGYLFYLPVSGVRMVHEKTSSATDGVYSGDVKTNMTGYIFYPGHNNEYVLHAKTVGAVAQWVADETLNADETTRIHKYITSGGDYGDVRPTTGARSGDMYQHVITCDTWSTSWVRKIQTLVNGNCTGYRVMSTGNALNVRCFKQPSASGSNVTLGGSTGNLGWQN